MRARGALARELDGVRDQVDEHLLHEAGVDLPGGKVRDHEFDVAAGAFRGHVVDDALHQLGEAHRLAVQRLAVEL